MVRCGAAALRKALRQALRQARRRKGCACRRKGCILSSATAAGGHRCHRPPQPWGRRGRAEEELPRRPPELLPLPLPMVLVLPLPLAHVLRLPIAPRRQRRAPRRRSRLPFSLLEALSGHRRCDWHHRTTAGVAAVALAADCSM